MQTYVAYYCVSTKGQHLGIDAQKLVVKNFIKEEDLIIASYEERKSGTNNERPEILKALALGKRKKTALVIAKLDRLLREVSFFSPFAGQNLYA